MTSLLLRLSDGRLIFRASGAVLMTLALGAGLGATTVATRASGADPSSSKSSGASATEPESANLLLPSASQSRDEAAYRQHIMLLADPFMEGRGPGTKGNRIAADYLKFHFERLGLRPAFLPPASTESGDSSAHSEAVAAAVFTQEFQAGREARTARATLNAVSAGKAATEFVQPSDYIVMGFSSDADLKEAELVFAGYSLERAGKEGVEYTSFGSSDDLTGKIAVVLRFEPMDERGRSLWTDQPPADAAHAGDPAVQGHQGLSGGAGWSGASGLAGKLQAVIQRNAAGVIVINPPGADDPRASKLETTTGTASWSRKLDVPVLMMSADAGERLVRAADAEGRSLMDLRRLADRVGLDEAHQGTKPGVIALPSARLNVDVKVERTPRTTWNVAAVLPGFGSLADEYVIIGAHYDHVGYGYTGGSRLNEMGVIHPGADDNASGTSGLLLAAELLTREYAAMRDRWNPGIAGDRGDPRPGGARSILFVGFSAEEMGLIGSREFVKSAPIEASKITCMINMDMIGRYGTTLGSGGDERASGASGASGGAAGGAGAHADPHAADPQASDPHAAAADPHAAESAPASAPESKPERSRRGVINSGAGLELGGVGTAEGWREIVTSAFEPTGLNLKFSPGGRGPSDHASFYSAGIPVLFVFTGLHDQYHTPRDTADLINIDGAVRVVYGVCRAALAAAQRPEVLKFTSTDKSKGGDTEQSSIRNVKVRFGIAPGSYADGELGVLVGEVYPNTSAGIAGIKAGDRLLKWNGQEIGDVAAWMTQLTQHKPGDVVEVTVQRKDGKTEVVPVTLKAREQMDQ